MNKKGSVDATPIFIFLISFWILATILSRYFEVNAVLTDIDTLKSDYSGIEVEEQNVIKAFFTDVFETLDQIPIINAFTPLLRIMSFQYSNQIPASLSIFLDSIAILSAFVVVSVFKR